MRLSLAARRDESSGVRGAAGLALAVDDEAPCLRASRAFLSSIKSSSWISIAVGSLRSIAPRTPAAAAALAPAKKCKQEPVGAF